MRAPSTRTWAVVIIALAVVLMVGLQIVASVARFPGPLGSLLNDYVGTPKSATVPWVGLGVAMVGVPTRWRISALATAVAVDALFTIERLLHTGIFAVGNGPMIVLTGLTLVVWWRWNGAQRATALHGIALGFLLIVATKIADTWLDVTAIARPRVLDEYVLLADHALAQPSWFVGRALDAAGPAAAGVLHWVYIELPLAAAVVAVYQLRNVTTDGWPRHYLVRTFLLLGLIGPVIYVVFPLVGPNYAFGIWGGNHELGLYWPHALPPLDMSPGPLAFDHTTPRNCMPSMHTAWALAVFIHSRRGPRWLRWGGAFWLVGTLAATLGFGYHYGVDLVAGAVLCVAVESVLREPVAGRDRLRVPLVAGGAVLFTGLLVCCRYLAPEMARHPWLFGPSIIGLLVVYCAAFHAAFFARSRITIRESIASNLAVPLPNRLGTEYG
ncbi:MAG TPA: DUF5933 domain-containing protein [Mycobacterium sp.]|nr:DUF5933 domain-containing protein [Mycobacterium sp.]